MDGSSPSSQHSVVDTNRLKAMPIHDKSGIFLHLQVDLRQVSFAEKGNDTTVDFDCFHKDFVSIEQLGQTVEDIQHLPSPCVFDAALIM